jgi:hypothetical protein
MISSLFDAIVVTISDSICNISVTIYDSNLTMPTVKPETFFILKGITKTGKSKIRPAMFHTAL